MEKSQAFSLNPANNTSLQGIKFVEVAGLGEHACCHKWWF